MQLAYTGKGKAYLSEATLHGPRGIGTVTSAVDARLVDLAGPEKIGAMVLQDRMATEELARLDGAEVIEWGDARLVDYDFDAGAVI